MKFILTRGENSLFDPAQEQPQSKGPSFETLA